MGTIRLGGHHDIAASRTWLFALALVGTSNIAACTTPYHLGGAAPSEESCENRDRSTMVLGAENSFNECGGPCINRLKILPSDRAGACDSVVLDLVSWTGTLMGRKRGALSAIAHERSRSLAAALTDTTIDATYGCPDCADGGASRITLSRNHVTTTHTYEFRKAPSALVDVDEFTQALITSLLECQSNDEVTIIPDCAL